MVDVTTLSYGVGTVGMLVGVAIVVQLLASTGGDHDGHFGYLLIIPGFATLMYATMALGVGTVTFEGYTVPIPRYVDWLVTTPVLVGYAAHVAGMDSKWIAGVAVADALMIVTGGLAVATAPPVRWAAFGVSSLFHLVLLGVIYGVLPAHAAERDATRRRLADVLQNHVGLLWIAYPVVWLLGPGLGLVSALGVALIITYLDVVAKVPYVYFVSRARHGFDGVTAGDAARGSPEPDRPAVADAD